MEIKDAIRKLEFMRDAYQALIDEGVNEGEVVGSAGEGVWNAETSIADVYAVLIEACNVSIAALQKADKKVPMRDGRDHYCPGCATYIKSYEDYCYACGQRIDWSHLRKKVNDV